MYAWGCINKLCREYSDKFFKRDGDYKQACKRLHAEVAVLSQRLMEAKAEVL
jgi:hypothetical protein